MIFGRYLTSILLVLTSSLQFGFITNFSGNALGNMREDFDFQNVTDFEIDCYNNISNIAAAIGGLIFIFVILKVKRKIIITIVNLLNALYWFLFLLVDNEKFILAIVLRGLQGLNLGCYASIVPPYVNEYCHDCSYGFFGTMIQVAIGLAGIITNIFFFAMRWDIIVIINGIISVVFAGIIWLAVDLNTGYIPKRTYHEFIFQKKYVKPLISIILAMFFQQATGINIVCMNIPALMSSIGLRISPYLQSVIVSISGCLATFVIAFVMDTAGRKATWIISNVGLIIGLVFYSYALQVPSPNWVIPFGVFLYNLCFGFGLGPIPWFMCAEIITDSAKIDASGINTFINMGFSFAVSIVFPLLVDWIGEFGAMIFFAIMALFAIIFGIFLIPEPERYDDKAESLI